MGSIEESPASHSNGTHFIDEELNSVGQSRKRLKKSDPDSFAYSYSQEIDPNSSETLVPDGMCFISCGHSVCTNPSQKSKEYSQTHGPVGKKAKKSDFNTSGTF